jgi:hypothetical protein
MNAPLAIAWLSMVPFLYGTAIAPISLLIYLGHEEFTREYYS